MKHSTNINALIRHMNRASDFLRWLQDEGDALIAAASLLGGESWQKRARAVVVTARKGGNIAARRNALAALHRLLHGGYASLLEGQDAWLFSTLHPDDPRATSAMLCAEALDRGLRALEALRLAGITNFGEVA